LKQAVIGWVFAEAFDFVSHDGVGNAPFVHPFLHEAKECVGHRIFGFGVGGQNQVGGFAAGVEFDQHGGAVDADAVG
jgi:hypothetical protein